MTPARIQPILEPIVNLSFPPGRLEREAKTIYAMIQLTCQAQHHPSGELCDDCQELADYAMARLAKCPFQEEKPTCAMCPVHCYKPDMRERIRGVMRFAGPRMLTRHPILAIRHLMDDRFQPVPAKPRSNKNREK